MKVKVGHSPDPDDAFMFYPIKKKLIDLKGYEVEEVVEDIETLNHLAMKGALDVSAVSAHAYAYMSDVYDVLASGASMGKGYGPVVVSKEKINVDEIEGKRIAIPGELTTATLLTKIYLPPGEYVVIRFDRIPDAVLSGEVDVGVLIHEGQITYSQMGLYKVVDLGEVWYKETGLPTPLGLDVAKKNISEDWAKIWRSAVEYSLSHPKEALEYALPYARGLSEELVDKFVRMYVNEYTVDMGEEGEEALRVLYEKAYEKGIIPKIPKFRVVR